MRPRIADDGDYPEPEPQIGVVQTFAPEQPDDAPLPREFPIGFHGSNRVDVVKFGRKRKAQS